MASRLDAIVRRITRRMPPIIPGVAPDSILFHQIHVGCDSDVLFVGDSHTLICGAHWAYPGCDVDARPGRASAEALEIVDRFLQPRHTVVVFEIATNDVLNSVSYAANLRNLYDRIEGRQLVLVNTWRQDGSATHFHVNSELATFHALHPEDTILVDFAAIVDGFRRPPLGPTPDYVHFTPPAYKGRIVKVNEAIAEARARAAAAAP